MGYFISKRHIFFLYICKYIVSQTVLMLEFMFGHIFIRLILGFFCGDAVDIQNVVSYLAVCEGQL